MKRSIVGVLVAVVAILAVNVAVAQSPTKVNVPFNFIVGQQAMPAGSYELQKVGDRATLIASADGAAKKIVLSYHCESREMQDPKLVFDKIGDRYFLSQIWMTQSESGLQLPASKLEKEVRMSANAEPAGAETVVIALR